MSKLKFLLVICLLFIPLLTLYYKSEVLGLQLVPQKASRHWKVELSVEAKKPSMVDNQPVGFPVPPSNGMQEISELMMRVNDTRIPDPVLKDSQGGSIVVNPAVGSGSTVLSFKVDMDQAAAPGPRKPPKSTRLSPSERERYTGFSEFTEDELLVLEKLDSTLTFPTDSKSEKLTKYFYYLADEVTLKPSSQKISDVIDLASGSYLAQAKTFVGLARRTKIPARMVLGIKFLAPAVDDAVRYNRVVLTEIFVGGQWIPYLPEGRVEGDLGDKYIVLCTDCEKSIESFNDKDLVSILVTPVKFDPVSSTEQLDRLSKSSSFWSWLSLHRLPLSVQAIILGIILVPFGTIAISFARVIVGIETFGIFMPILLTLFFLETSLWFGFLFFSIVLVLGLAQRYLLDRFHLLAVPRLSILLSFTIIVYILFSVACLSYDVLSVGQSSLGYFPIVIITVFIEKLSLSLIEEGTANTLRVALGTFVVAFICYLLLAFSWLKSFLFNHPEMILFSIGMNLAIGSYTGLRLLELIRFKAMKGRNEFQF